MTMTTCLIFEIGPVVVGSEPDDAEAAAPGVPLGAQAATIKAATATRIRTRRGVTASMFAMIPYRRLANAGGRQADVSKLPRTQGPDPPAGRLGPTMQEDGYDAPRASPGPSSSECLATRPSTRSPRLRGWGSSTPGPRVPGSCRSRSIGSRSRRSSTPGACSHGTRVLRGGGGTRPGPPGATRRTGRPSQAGNRAAARGSLAAARASDHVKETWSPESGGDDQPPDGGVLRRSRAWKTRLLVSH